MAKRKLTAQQIHANRVAHWNSFIREGLDPITWGAHWSFAEAAKRYADAGFTDPAEARAYQRALLDYCDAPAAFQWRELGFTPEEAQAWAKSGHGPALAAQERAQGYAPRRYTPGKMQTK
jgi:hypothetical protein